MQVDDSNKNKDLTTASVYVDTLAEIQAQATRIKRTEGGRKPAAASRAQMAALEIERRISHGASVEQGKLTWDSDLKMVRTKRGKGGVG